ncbi:hypothetical protein HY489_06655 [Candidatus Woesearchaeota archaeon]|nr:hypothetical protein [Candidatus Woesearchaeota archaeon]
MKNTTTYALVIVALAIVAIGAAVATNQKEQSMNEMMTSMQGMMGSMQSMMEQCQKMMGGDMGKMMTGMISSNATMAKPEGMSQEEHESHHQ